MTDREKVIKGLECAIGIRGVKDCDNCPYDNDFNCIGCDIVMRDAIALLKGQEPVAVYESKISRCACGNTVNRYWHPKFCGYCGKELMWY